MEGPTSPPAPTIAVIGAGPCGLVALKTLLQAGFQARGYEMGSQVGGLWVFQNDNGRGGAYRSLRMNTSRPRTEWRDFPMPEHFGDYPTHSQMAEYFRAYAKHFDLLKNIAFQTEVVHVEPNAKGCQLTVVNRTTGETQTEEVAAVVVASGHHFSPRIPREFSEAFTGTLLHSHQYIDPATPQELRGRRVCVVGMGNSAMDIAVELEASGSVVTLAARTAVWVLPKYWGGRPIDQGNVIPSVVRGKLRRRISTWGVKWLYGSMRSFGLPEPDHLVGEAHPTLSDSLPTLVKEGRVQVEGKIRRIDGKSIEFDGKIAREFDALVCATGYHVEFPFFDPEVISAPGNDLPLFARIFHPRQRHIFFVGLAQTLGAITVTAERQAQFLAEHLAGNYHLPDQDEMNRLLNKERQATRRRYGTSERHTMQLDPEHYALFLEKELARGRKRAQKARGIPFETAN